MKIALLSDIHIDINDYSILSKAFKNLDDDYDCMVIPGDLANTYDAFRKVTEWIMDKTNKIILYTPGNHDFYDTLATDVTVYQKIEMLKYVTKNTNFHVLYNDFIMIDGIKFIGSTLWTDFSNVKDDTCRYISNGLNDFRYINYDNNVDKYNQICDWMTREHKKCLNYIKNEINERSVLITHHGLSNQSISERFIGDPLNHAYVSHNDDIYNQITPLIHFHGHVHTARNYWINKTNVIVHPMGYVYYDRDPNNNFKIVEL